MTIKPGGEWGRIVPVPEGLVIAESDRAIVDALDAGLPVAAGGGDIARTLGSPRIAGRNELLTLPMDLIDVRLDDRPVGRAIAHVTAIRRWWRGSGLRGPVLLVMNAEFAGPRDVAPRGHPNDGRVESLLVDASMSMRERVTARSRSRTARHLPHPAITTRSVRRHRWDFDEPLVVRVDGVVAGRARRIEVDVLPDAAVVYA